MGRRIVVEATERKRAEDALRKTEKLAAAGRLAASIAHEINNPLEAVTNLLYLLRHQPSLDAFAISYADLAQHQRCARSRNNTTTDAAFLPPIHVARGCQYRRVVGFSGYAVQGKAAWAADRGLSSVRPMGISTVSPANCASSLPTWSAMRSTPWPTEGICGWLCAARVPGWMAHPVSGCSLRTTVGHDKGNAVADFQSHFLPPRSRLELGWVYG